MQASSAQDAGLLEAFSDAPDSEQGARTISRTMTHLIEALFLGFIEGFTEFLPVSSTGHLLLAAHFLGFESTGKTFEVLIQLGAILAILSSIRARLIKIARGLPYDPDARRFVIGVLLAFLPAAVIGAGLHGFIKDVLFNPWLVCTP